MSKFWYAFVGFVLVACFAACEVEEGDADATGDAVDDTAANDTDEGPAESQVCGDDSLRQTSCLADFFSCYDPSGTCTEGTASPSGNIPMMSSVYANGAEWQFGRDEVSGDAAAKVIGSDGVTCATGTGSEAVEDEIDLTFTHPGDTTTTLNLVTDGSGNMVVTCPDGTTEAYSASEAETILGCQGVSCN